MIERIAVIAFAVDRVDNVWVRIRVGSSKNGSMLTLPDPASAACRKPMNTLPASNGGTIESVAALETTLRQQRAPEQSRAVLCHGCR